MPRIRTIKPELFLSETVSSLTLEAERSFIGLLTQADDRGRFRESAPVLNGALWPHRPNHSVADMVSDLDEIVEKGLLCRYQEGGKNYLHFVTWDEHQKISHPSTRNLCPPCPIHDGGSPRNRKVSGKFPEPSGNTQQGKERKGKELVKSPTLSTEGGPGGTKNARASSTRSLPANAGVKKEHAQRSQAKAHTKKSNPNNADKEDEMGIYDEPVPPFDDLRERGAVTKGKRAVGKNGVSPKYLADVERVIEHLKAARKRIGASTRTSNAWWTEIQSLLRGTASRSAFTADQLCDLIDFATSNHFWHAHVSEPKGIIRHGSKIYLSDEFVLWSVDNGKPSANRPRNEPLSKGRTSTKAKRRIDADAPPNPDDYSEAL